MKEKKLEFYGGEWISFMPIALFVILIILTTFFCGCTSNGATWVPAFLSLLFPLFLAKDKKAYAEAIIGGISDKNAAIPISCWIFSGVLARILQDSGFADGLAGLSCSMKMNSTAFLAASFLCTMLFAMSIGTGMGAVAMSMGVFYPAGVVMGIAPAFLAGSILSGASMGDNMSFVSDTTICSATALEVEPVKCVKTRWKYALCSGGLTLIAIVLVSKFYFKEAGTLPEVVHNDKALIMILPMVLTLFLAAKSGNIIVATSFGVVLAAGTAVLAGLMDMIRIEKKDSGIPALIQIIGEEGSYRVEGILYEGMEGMVQIVILCLLLFGMINIMRQGGGDIKLLKTLSTVVKNPVSAEIMVSLMITLLSALISLNAPALLLVGSSFAKPYAKKYGISSYYMANLIAAHSVTFCYCAPWTAVMMLAVGMSEACGVPLTGIQISPFMFYAYISMIVMILVTCLGIGRNDGRKIKQ